MDEWLLNQVVKHVNHDEIGSFARDLGVPESVYSNITKEKDKTFKVMSRLFTPILSGYHADTPITIKAEAIHEADSRIH